MESFGKNRKMKIIEKILIKHFRSFGERTEVFELSDLNIFSGANDSGKSNILRALNLFFYEDKIDFYHDFNFENDFSRAQEEILKGQKKGKSFIEIRVLFHPLKKQFNSKVLPDKFWIIKRFYRDSTKNFIDIKDEGGKDIKHTREKDGKIIERKEDVSKAKTNFLKKINFQYIPAIKDERFSDYLKEKYQDAIGKSENELDKTKTQTISEWKSEMTSLNITKILDEKIKEESKELFEDFAKRASEIKKANFNIPYLEIAYASAIDVETDEKIPLKNRGDGVQAKFIPVILDEIAKRNRARPIIIWAFEEPENSYEYKNAQKLADEFLNEYSRANQIFITTHSFNFLALGGENVSTYRVYKDDVLVRGRDEKENNYSVSRIFLIPDENKKQARLLELDHPEREKLEEELGIYELNKDLEDMFQQKKLEMEALQLKKQEYAKIIAKAHPSKIFICEDSAREVIELWNYWFDLYGIKDVKIMTSEGSTKNIVENGVRHVRTLVHNYNPKIFRQIDRDSFTDEQVSLIKEKVFKNEKKDLDYAFEYLPVNEIENFAVILDSKSFSSSFWEKNRESVVDHFQRVASSSCKKMVKEFDREIEAEKCKKFLSKNGDTVEITQGMRDFSIGEWRKYFPGKEICKKIPDYNAIDYLKKITESDLPDELAMYIEKIKKFFEK